MPMRESKGRINVTASTISPSTWQHLGDRRALSAEWHRLFKLLSDRKSEPSKPVPRSLTDLTLDDLREI
jgi:hypothetical protein